MSSLPAAADWERIGAELDARGTATAPGLFDRETCRAIAAAYTDEALFRARIVMARHGFGRGEYKYFAYPLPDLIAELNFHGKTIVESFESVSVATSCRFGTI